MSRCRVACRVAWPTWAGIASLDARARRTLATKVLGYPARLLWAAWGGAGPRAPFDEARPVRAGLATAQGSGDHSRAAGQRQRPASGGERRLVWFPAEWPTAVLPLHIAHEREG